MYTILNNKNFTKYAPLIARIMIAIGFGFSAVGKIPGSESYQMEVEMSANAGLPFAGTMVLLAFILEVVTVPMLILGWHARIAASLLIGFLVLIILTFVKDLSQQMDMITLFSSLNMIAALIYVAVYGAKSFAVRPD